MTLTFEIAKNEFLITYLEDTNYSYSFVLLF